VQRNNSWPAIVQRIITSHMDLTHNIPVKAGQRGNEMSDVQKFGEEFQRVGKNGFDGAVSSFSEANKGFQAIAAELTAYSKKSFEDGTRAFQQLLDAKSFEQVIEIQSQYARMAYEAYVAGLSKLGEMYAVLTRNTSKPVEQAAAKAGLPNRLRSA
jgi:Phasin protein